MPKVEGPAFVLLPGQDEAVRRMLVTHVELPPGWRFVSAKIGNDVRGWYKNAGADNVARVTLFHPETAPAGALHTERFGVVFKFQKRTPDAERLARAILAGVEATEADIRWSEPPVIERNELRAPKPDAPEVGRSAPLPEDLDEMLCLAPWTTMTLYGGQHRQPVPCAPSWVDTEMSPGDIARELGTTRLRVLQQDERSRAQSGLEHYDLMNEDWPLPEMWNGPLYRQMRREMASGGRSPRCRDTCRVVLGVEERGKPFFRIPDHALAPQVAANRRLLIKELREGKSVLTATPLELTIGVSAHCNITCGFCSGPQGEFGELTPRRYDEVVAWLPTLAQLSVVGPGEPLMSKSFGQLLKHIATGNFPSLTVSITTNGTLARPEWLERHERVRWGQIRFSVNAGSAATHERMTGKRLFDRLIENIEAVVALRSRCDPDFAFVLSCVLSKLVIGDLSSYAELVHKYGALPVLEPMTGNMNNLSPYTTEVDCRRVMDECGEVARSYQGRNAAIVTAFAAMERYARGRIEQGNFSQLPMK